METIERGKRVLVKAFGGQQLERIVWKDVGKGLLLTTSAQYELAVKSNTEPIAVGFPKDDLIKVLHE
ncbi:MAG TPA: hypothetical protein VEG28_02355 [Dehalococcoidia bacterium]|nr:hypothetical protein [Dehalococcoidia bacterium]